MGDPTFTQADADEIYDELRTLHIELDADPLVFGPKRMNARVAEVRGMLGRCERIFLDVAQRLHRAKRDLRISATTLDLAKKHLFANDPETRAGRSVGDRDAIATGKLKGDVAQTNRLELMVQDLDAVITVVKAKRSDLRDTQGRLRDQIRLCQEEIGLGNRWGSSTPDNKGGPDLKPNLVDGSSDIDELLGGVDGEIHLGAQQGDWEDPEEFQIEPTEDDSAGDSAEAQPHGALLIYDKDPEPLVEPKEDPPVEPETEDPEEPDKAEPEEPAETEDLDPDVVLPSTSSMGEVDAFLDEPAPEPRKRKPAPPTKVTSLDETALDDILSSFEKKD